MNTKKHFAINKRRVFIKKSLLLSSSVIASNFLFNSCFSKKTAGPFFGNGAKNGWVDQTSAVIWARLTKTREPNWNGRDFIHINEDNYNQYISKLTSESDILKAQIPDGYELNAMKGACPGAEGEIKLVLKANGNNQPIVFNWKAVNSEMDYTLQWKILGLNPNTIYTYKLLSRLNRDSEITGKFEGKFKTPPAITTEKNINFCVVSCHDYLRRDSDNGHKIYPAMQRLNPNFYVHTGDIEYYDKPNPYAMTKSLMRFKWNRLFGLPFQKTFFQKNTTYFMKDDHDTLKDDCYPGQTYGTVSFEEGLKIFDQEQFPSNNKPYKTIVWGKSLQIWLLDSRNYRSKNTDPDGISKTILGKEQKAWLFNSLLKSEATFKVLISASPIIGPDRKNKSDNHSNSNFAFERNEILGIVEKVKNVYLCNGDRHWQYASHLKEKNIWEFCSGAGSDAHAGGWDTTDIRPEHTFLRVKGGFLSVHVSTDPVDKVSSIAFVHRDVDGNEVNVVIFNDKNES